MEEYQGELFPRFDESKGRAHRKSRLKRPKLVRERYIKLGEDKIALLLLSFLFTFVLAYVWGYRRGMRVERYEREIRVSVPASVVSEKKDFSRREVLSASKKTVAEPEPSSYYTLQLVAYKSLSYARDEKKKLKELGYDAYILERGKYKILYLGKFRKREEAEKVLKKLRSIYKDAFVKRVKGGE